MDFETLAKQNNEIMKQNQIIMDSAAALVNAVSVKLKTENDLIDLVSSLHKEMIELKNAITGATDLTEPTNNGAMDKLVKQLEDMGVAIDGGFNTLLAEFRRK